MRLTEELLMMFLDEQSGFIELQDSWDFSCVVSGAVLADLALDYRIDSDLTELSVIDPTPTGESFLDATLKDIAAEETTQTMQYWVEKNTSRTDEVVTSVLDQLVERGILHYEVGGFWERAPDVALTQSYTDVDGTDVLDPKTRILNVLLNDEPPDPRDVLLISLFHSCDFLRLLVAHDDYVAKLERIELLANADLLGQSIAASVHQSSLLPRPRARHASKPFPKVRTLELMKVSAFREGNLPAGFHSLYRKFGPVAELPIELGSGRPVVLLSGPEVNQWANKSGRLYLRSKDHMRDFEAVFGASRSMPGMDGAEHFRLRKAMRPAFARTALAQRLPELTQICRDSLTRWEEGTSFSASKTLLRHVSDQVSSLLLDVDCSSYIDELLLFKKRALSVHAGHFMPAWILSTPRMNRAKQFTSTLMDSIKASHTVGQRKDRPLDLADAVIELHRQDQQFFPETDLTFPLVAAMVASIYMGNALAFALYAMLKDPSLYERVYEEAEALFGGGRTPTEDDFTGENISVTDRVFLESERLYPIIQTSLRTIINACEVAGYELEPNTRVIIAHTVTHFMEKFYPNPTKFDIDRYLPERREHLAQPGIYVPYGIGTHHCLGHRYLELQMVVNMLLIVYHFKLELEPNDYQMKMNPFPSAAPRKKMRIRVAEVRNDL